MKRIIVFLFTIVIIIVTLDCVFGFAIKRYTAAHGLKGDYQPISYALDSCHEQVIILGSSVVLNSLMPAVIEDTLGCTCYNAGANGQTLQYFHTVLNAIFKRYTPKLVILGLKLNDLATDDSERYYALVPFYKTGFQDIDSTLESKRKGEYLFLKSNFYRYNTIWFRILLYNFFQSDERGEGGFIPKPKPSSPPIKSISEGDTAIAASKLALFEDIIKQCELKGVKLVVFTPPAYVHFTSQPKAIARTHEICLENDVPYYYDVEDSVFQSHQEWFFDRVHLTAEGALVYSRLFATRLKAEI